jgi:hypothetical protein
MIFFSPLHPFNVGNHTEQPTLIIISLTTTLPTFIRSLPTVSFPFPKQKARPKTLEKPLQKDNNCSSMLAGSLETLALDALHPQDLKFDITFPPALFSRPRQSS